MYPNSMYFGLKVVGPEFILFGHMDPLGTKSYVSSSRLHGSNLGFWVSGIEFRLWGLGV